MNILEILSKYQSEGMIREELQEVLWDYAINEGQTDPIVWSLLHTLELISDGLHTEDYLDGQIQGVLSVFAPCPEAVCCKGYKLTVRGCSDAATIRA